MPSCGLSGSGCPPPAAGMPSECPGPPARSSTHPAAPTLAWRFTGHLAGPSGQKPLWTGRATEGPRQEPANFSAVFSLRWLTRTSDGWLVLGLGAYLADAVLGAVDPGSGSLPGGTAGQWAGAVVRGLIIVIMASRLPRRRSRRRIGRYLLVIGALDAGATLGALTQSPTGWTVATLLLAAVLVACANMALAVVRDEPTDEAVEAASMADHTKRFEVLQQQAFAELRRRNDAVLASRQSSPPGTRVP